MLRVAFERVDHALFMMVLMTVHCSINVLTGEGE